VFAELGYFVLSVNEPLDDAAIPHPYSSGASAVGVTREQFWEAYNPLATMETVANALVESGSVDRAKVGIAGYSRGSSIARFAMSHSSVFSAASSADANWWDAGGFWGGGAFSRTLYRNLLGGSPFDPAIFPNYLAFSASARAQSFAGPLLQQYTLADAKDAVEMDQLLKEAHVPTELYFYPSEAHVFWHPRHRASAMEQNLDWFQYWLNGKRNLGPGKETQYARWDDMATEWRMLITKRDASQRTSAAKSAGAP
jgi:dienelactone hydrolase